MADFVSINQNDQWVVDSLGRVIGVRRFGQHYPPKPTVFLETDPASGAVSLAAGTDAIITSGAALPSDADGKPDGSIYFQT